MLPEKLWLRRNEDGWCYLERGGSWRNLVLKEEEVGATLQEQMSAFYQKLLLFYIVH